ncbi:type IX secretion system membrane protein PorP/SprF [Cytophagaceae bacterium ABcell3]|nr:type IX secretion system membrane protein PorP/SprF [Cytophagaceae bacterium ABcell3]
MSRKALYIVLLFIQQTAFAQDPQFSQYYAAPLLLNPAMAGSGDCIRAGFNARTQWVGLPGGAFNTGSMFVDMNMPDIRSGFGLMALYDQIGTPRMSSSEISLFYSFLAPVNRNLNFRFGLQGTFASRGLDYSRLIFEDQFRGTTIVDPTTNDPARDHTNVNYGDVSAGLLIYGEDTYWLGFSAHHLTRPEQAFFLPESRLPIKYSVHGGYNFIHKNGSYQKDNWVYIIPTFMYKRQAEFDQFDLGVYVIKSYLMAGVWYRGIPFKVDENIPNNDAISMQVGVQYEDFSIIYSYDYTISRLHIRNTWGSHEISLLYKFCMDWPRNKGKKPPKHVRKPSCPDFKRSKKHKWNSKGF